MIGKHSGYLEVQFSANDTVRIFAPTGHPRHLMLNVRVGGSSALVAPRTRRVAKGIRSIDERNGREVCGLDD